MKASEQVYWMKAGLGVITGIICYYIQSSFGIQGQLVFMVGITLYIAYSEGLAVVMKVDRNRTIKIAMGSYLFLWMLSWTLLNTLGYYGWI